jgi:uncharacterized protein with PQ loop repeat
MAIVEGPKLVLFVLQWLPMVAFSYVLLAPSLTIWEIWNNQSVGKYESFPFVSFIGNCGVWVVYGLLDQKPTIYVSNGIGYLAGIIFTYVYASLEKIPSQNYLFSFGMNIIAVVMVLVIQLFKVEKDAVLFVLGIVGAGTAIILLSSPLVAMKTVIKEKNSESMPFQTSLAMWLNSTAWSIFGLLCCKENGDPFVYGPNLIGFLTSSIQLALIFKYPASTKSRLETEGRNLS